MEMENTGDEKRPEREAQIGRELNLGNEGCVRLGTVVTTLEERLSAVLRNEPACTDEAGKEPEKLVPLAHEIRTIHEEVTIQTNRLESVIDRLEL